MDLVDTLLGAGMAALALVAAAAVASRRTPSEATRSALQHLAAGVICAVVAAELVPEALKTGRSSYVCAGFVAGLVVMLGAKAVADRLAGPGGRTGLLLATGLDVTIDGLLIGVAFALGPSMGGLLVLAFTLELTAVGLALGAVETSFRRSLATASVLAFPVLPAAVVGHVVLSQLSVAFEACLLGFATSVLLYLVVEELMREAHEVEEHWVATLSFFAGFLGLLLLQMQIDA